MIYDGIFSCGFNWEAMELLALRTDRQSGSNVVRCVVHKEAQQHFQVRLVQPIQNKQAISNQLFRIFKLNISQHGKFLDSSNTRSGVFFMDDNLRPPLMSVDTRMESRRRLFQLIPNTGDDFRKVKGGRRPSDMVGFVDCREEMNIASFMTAFHP